MFLIGLPENFNHYSKMICWRKQPLVKHDLQNQDLLFLLAPVKPPETCKDGLTSCPFRESTLVANHQRTPEIEALRIAVIGIGYVGLPVAVEFGRKQPTIGFDTNPARVKDLSEGNDETLEVSSEELASANYLTFSSDPGSLQESDVYIITVPTPIDEQRAIVQKKGKKSGNAQSRA